jgi:hypothetical protein
MTTSTTARAPLTSTPARRTTVVLAALYAAVFVGALLGGSGEISPDASGAKVIKEFTSGDAAVQVGGYALVVAAILLVFWGAAMRSRLTSARRTWTADAVLAGSIALALTLVGWTVTLFALKHAVDSGVPEVAQAANIMDNASFVPAMLGLACTMIGVGVTTWRDRTLPRWLAGVSVALGAIAPLGPGGFAPFTLFPIWVVVVSALVRPADDRPFGRV